MKPLCLIAETAVNAVIFTARIWIDLAREVIR